MPIDPAALSALADEYTRGMTPIRGRRVQRLLKREFAGADRVAIVPLDTGPAAVLGLGVGGAACCISDGRGLSAALLKWRYGSAHAERVRFDLLKDSLPVLGVEQADLPEGVLTGAKRGLAAR